MANVSLVAPALRYVRWDCQRCGHRGGMARTTIPFEWSAPLWAVMETQLRQKLIRVHQAKQGCIALAQDFVLTDVNPAGDRAA